MRYEMDLKNFDTQKTFEAILDKVKESLIDNLKGKSTVIIAIDNADGISVIPAGKAGDVLTLIAIELVEVIQIYKITDVDSILECFAEKIKSYFQKDGD